MFLYGIVVLQATLPPAPVTSNFEQYDPNRQEGKVLIRVIPEVAHILDEKNGKSSTAKFKISSTVKKMHRVLVEGGAKALINHT